MPEIIIAAMMLITVGSIMLAGLSLVYARDLERRIDGIVEQIDSMDAFLETAIVEDRVRVQVGQSDFGLMQ